MDIENIIRKYIVNEIMNEQDESILKLDDPLLSGGCIDSVGFMKLINFLENKFDIIIPEEELIPGNYETIHSISNIVRKNSIGS